MSNKTNRVKVLVDYFCPSCHQKRVLEFGEFLYTEVLKQVPHRQWVFSIPKRLRRYFMQVVTVLALRQTGSITHFT